MAKEAESTHRQDRSNFTTQKEHLYYTSRQRTEHPRDLMT